MLGIRALLSVYMNTPTGHPLTMAVSYLPCTCPGLAASPFASSGSRTLYFLRLQHDFQTWMHIRLTWDIFNLIPETQVSSRPIKLETQKVAFFFF
jgi:hypothetical protein